MTKKSTAPRPAPPEPQTQDLVRRLRSLEPLIDCDTLSLEAADEIERLRAALERIAANNDFLFLAEMAEFAREALAVSRLEPTHADQS